MYLIFLLLFSITRVKEIIDSLGGMDFYGPPVSRGSNFTRLLTHVMAHYGVSPLFKIIVQPRGKIGVSLVVLNSNSVQKKRSWKLFFFQIRMFQLIGESTQQS